MYKTIYDIGPEFFTTSNTQKKGKTIGTIAIILIIIGVIGFAVDGVIGFDMRRLGLIFGFSLGFIAFVYNGVGSRLNKDKQKLVSEMGMDGVLNEIHNEALCVIKEKYSDSLLTVITPKHIYDLNYGIYSTDKMSYVWSISTKGNGEIKIYTLDDRILGIGHGMRLHGVEEENVYRALRYIKPDLLVGYSSENKKEHQRRVQAYKEQSQASH